MNNRARWWVVVIYAAAMAWVESAVVYYLRTMINRIDPYQANPLPMIGGLGPAEMVRELATMIMLLTVGILAGRNWRSRLGFTALAFGVWDLLYYVFLRVLCGWPRTPFDWDILFLLPLPWWGPVWAPVSIALLMVWWGTLSSRWEGSRQLERRREWTGWVMNFIGIALALYVFMADTMRVAGQGVEALRKVLPARFNWPLFMIALALMAAPILELLWPPSSTAEKLPSRRPSPKGEGEKRRQAPALAAVEAEEAQ